MDQGQRLRETFLARAGAHAARHLAAQPDLEAQLEALLTRAREAWPRLRLPLEDFLAHVAARMLAEQGGAPTLGELHAADLYLAFGCARGEAEALAAFESQVLARVRIRARNMEADFEEEVRQTVRERLLVAPAGAAPRIEEYSGRGPLLSWVQVAAARMALTLREKAEGRRERPEAELPAVASPRPDPEREHLQRHYGREFEQALEAAIVSLSARERNVLRLYFLDGLSIDQIGGVLRVHRSTAARWVAAVRSRLMTEVHQALRGKLGLSPTELESLMGQLRSQLDIHLSQLLARAAR